MKTLRSMMGYERLFDEGETLSETDFVLCGHCQATVDVTPGKSVTDAGAFCSGCAVVICPRCARLAARSGLCQPFEVELQVYERNVETLRRWGIDNLDGIVVPSTPVVLPEPGHAGHR